MGMDLAGVIDKIKQEGVEKAEEKSAEMIKEAEQKAVQILEEAEKKKKEIVAQGTQEVDRLLLNAENELKQASRKVLIALRSQIIGLFDSIIKKEISGAFSPEMLKELIVKIVTKCMEKEQYELEVLLSKPDKGTLSQLLETALQNELKKGVTIKASPAIEKGFRIGEKGSNLYYDFTDEAIAETFNFYISRKVKKMILAETGEDG